MLTRLTISNYAIIDNLTVDFHPKLNSVTGETGAGKSILLGALGLILGNRAELSVLKDKTKKCVVEGIFEIGTYKLDYFFAENDLDYAGSTILRREITPAGTSRAFINDTPVNLKTLRELALLLIDIHSQHQNLELGNHRFQLDLVDTVSGANKLLNSYREVYTEYRDLQNSLKELIEKSAKESAELDYLQFQFDQLNEAVLIEKEQDELEILLAQLTHAEEIKNTLADVQQLIDDERFSVLSNLKDSRKRLEKIQNYIPEIPDLVRRLESSLLEIKDILDETEHIAAGVEHDPEKIEKTTARLNLIYNLEQKHHVKTVAELIGLKNLYEEKIGQVTGYADEISDLKGKIEATGKILAAKAEEISGTRKNSFATIEKAILNDLLQLGMSKARIQIRHAKLPDFTVTGTDVVYFHFSANSDIELNEISKVASGGEMSRLMLAIKNLLRKSKALPTVIFDEIDTGVSGEIALKMGNIIKSFSDSAQIINITHLPQIAAKGDAHYVVYKYEENGKTQTSVQLLRDNDRLIELAKMLGGEGYSEATLKMAKELIG